jgi:pimeloyl-ACP methyl ester carboxylesterase
VLLVMLPGAYSRPPEFVDEGFVAAVRSRGLAADIVVADAHLGYYNERTIVKRLRDDVVLPALGEGYSQVWLVGISIGGFGALGYAARHGSELAGVVTLAPYLGRRTLQREIADAGGPLAWRASQALAAADADDLDRDIWAWLATPTAAPPVYLGFGRDDRFAESHQVLGALLPSGRSFDTPGGHDWPAWRAAWHQWLDRGLLPANCQDQKAG